MALTFGYTENCTNLEAVNDCWQGIYQVEEEDGRLVARPVLWDAEPLTAGTSELMLTAMRGEFVRQADGGQVLPATAPEFTSTR